MFASISGNAIFSGLIRFKNSTPPPPSPPVMFNRLYSGGTFMDSFNMDTYAPVTDPTPDDGDQAGLAVSQQLGLLAQLSYNSPNLRLFDITLASPTTVSGPSTLPVDPQCVAFSRDSTYMAVGESLNNGFVKVYDTSDWSLVSAIPSPPTTAGTNYVSFSPTADIMAVSSNNNAVYIYNTSVVPFTLVTTLAVASSAHQSSFKPDGTQLAVAINSDATPCRVYNTNDWSLATTLTSGDRGFNVSYSRDGDFLYVNDAYNAVNVLVYQTSDYTVLGSPIMPYPTNGVTDVVWSNDSSKMFIQYDDGIAVYNTTTAPFTHITEIAVTSGAWMLVASYTND